METTLDRKTCFGSKCGRGYVEEIAFQYVPHCGLRCFWLMLGQLAAKTNNRVNGCVVIKL
jgi:hypothetical protein